jgi:exoribonuclease R
LRWLEARIDKSLQGVIIDIKSKCLVVSETSTEITGKIDIKTLPKDVYVLASNKLTLLGKYSKSKFGVGEKINIKVSQIDMINQDISFELKQG